MVELSPEQFESIIERAAERGAAKALEGVGLGDQEARQDMSEMRSWNRSMRSAKGTAFQTLIAAATMLLIGLIGLGAFAKIITFIGGDGGAS